MSDKPQAKHLKDYRPPCYLIDDFHLDFLLDEDSSLVKSRLSMRRNPDPRADAGPLRLDGVDLELVEILMDGKTLEESDYRLEDEALELNAPPERFTLDVTTRIRPQDNTSLEGLYKSGGNFCTQCESEGFRKITYFLDRPDVLARYTTRVEADKSKYPVLLSNGNLVAAGEAENGRHWARWEDPFPKPSYLFALVAGDLVCREDSFRTGSGRQVDLRIWVRERDLDKTAHAMRSLKKAMAWDEEAYGCEYDLDIFNIVAVDDFNMGAMENKSLNIFNTQYVLARPDTATDQDYVDVEAVIAHEYFHNWTGNRVTVCNWFQLSLKEGLTVFRDQQFTADMNSAAVKRIDDVNTLRIAQFPEDAGPQAHPVRPESYIEMNNFYTTTVYEKGAELIRMMHTLLGPERYRKGMDLYFERHDGKAVTCDDFVAAMEDAGGVDLKQFRLWYSQAGTPLLEAAGEHDPAAATYTLNIKQSAPPTPGQSEKRPLHIPLAMGLISSDGEPLPLRLAGEAEATGDHRVLDVKAAEQSFRFLDVAEKPVPSLLRGFSAPVRLESDLSRTELSFLMAHDSDSFNRWEASQQLSTDILLEWIGDYDRLFTGTAGPAAPAVIVDAYRAVLENESLDPALAARALSLPGMDTLVGRLENVDTDKVHGAHKRLRTQLAAALRELFDAVHERSRDEGPYTIDPRSMGLRSLKNLCLGYLALLPEGSFTERIVRQFDEADNMTDEIAALAIIMRVDGPERADLLARFYAKWREEPLVVNKWFRAQAMSPEYGRPAAIEDLLEHEAFDIKNPNKVRAVLGAFSHGNILRFHEKDGAGYRLVADQILRLDPINPQVPARIADAFDRWLKFDPARRRLMRAELERIVAAPDLSRNCYEIVSKALQAGSGVGAA